MQELSSSDGIVMEATSQLNPTASLSKIAQNGFALRRLSDDFGNVLGIIKDSTQRLGHFAFSGHVLQQR